jgi:hypothetical protein
MAESKAKWVVVGGKTGEAAHCTRCGEGLSLGGSQPIYIAIAMMDAFVNHHIHCRENGFSEAPPQSVYEWFRGRDIGTSSLTIYSVFMHTDSPHSGYDVPHDPSDFGRCYRLLKLMPSWKDRLDEVAAKFPKWKPFAERWSELTALYEEELPSGSAPKLYKLMQELR